MKERIEPVRMPGRKRSVLPQVRALGQAWGPHLDLYHWALRLRWDAFFGLVAVVFVLVNALFAVLYIAQPGSVANVSSFEEALSFSVQTLATIGYGGMMPQTRWGHALVAAESLAGILGTALVTGLTFAKFARPRALVLFSEKCCIGKRDGVPHLALRMANWRHNLVAEAQLRVMVLIEEVTREGEVMRRPHELSLVRDRTAVFNMTWTAFHRIDPTSPFHGDGALERLRAAKAEIYLSLTGLDETSGSTIHARHRYQLEDIAWDSRFRDVLSVLPDGTRVVDYRHFHEVEPLPSD